VCCDDVSEAETGLSVPANQEKLMVAASDRRRLARALAELPEDYREALVLRYQEEMPMKDLAVALEVSVSGAKMRVHRGLNRLRQILDGPE
jgi:RNA polymerase sigma-70 factor (ECF subfamily)